MTSFFAFTIVGIVTGSIFAVAASGLVVTYTASGVFNIAHGAIGMLMAFVYWQLRVGWHWPAPLALTMVLLVLAPLFGAGVERFLIRKVQGKAVVTSLVVTIGLMVGLIGVVQTVWKPESRVLEGFFGGSGFSLGSVFITWHQTITIVTAIGLAFALRLFLFRTRTGMSMRAVVDDPNLAGLHGARPTRISGLSWALGSSLAALAGILIAPALQLSVLPLTLLVLDAYAAAMVGRLKNLTLTFAGALGLGLAKSYAVGYMPNSGAFKSAALQGLRLSIPTIMLFATLLLLPQAKLRAARVMVQRRSLAVPDLRRSLTAGAVLVVTVWVVSGALSAANLSRLGAGLAFALIMLSLVPLSGYGGQVSLCQMTFAGLGAFAMVKLGAGGSPLGLVAAVALAAAVGAVIALPSLRLQGLYLALSTMAFAVLMDNMFFVDERVFGFGGVARVARPSLFGLSLAGDRAYVVFLAVVFAALAAGVLALRRGPFGRVLAAMRDSEVACATLGLNMTRTKLAVFTLSAAIAGLGGALFGGLRTSAGANDFIMVQSLPVLLLVVIYGISTTSAALAGGLSLGLLPLVSTAFPALAGVTFLFSGLAGVVLGSNPDGLLVGLFRWVADARARLVAGVPRPPDTLARPAVEQVEAHAAT